MPKTWGTKTAEERRTARRERILRSAIKLYGQRGYRNTSVKAVCDEAGLTERYFYESFSNSEQLLHECFLTIEHGLLQRMREVANREGGNVLERARAGLLVYLEHIKQDPATARVFLLELANVSSASEALVSASLDRFGSLLMEVLGADPAFKQAPSPLLLRGVVGGGLHVVQAWASTDFRESSEVVAELNLRLYTSLAAAAPIRIPASPTPRASSKSSRSKRLGAPGNESHNTQVGRRGKRVFRP